MGHDISGYNPQEPQREIAYLRRGAFNNLAIKIYEALDAKEYGGMFSGIGEAKTFTKDELINALEYIGTTDEMIPERKFLNDCLANMDANNKILISFC